MSSIPAAKAVAKGRLQQSRAAADGALQTLNRPRQVRVRIASGAGGGTLLSVDGASIEAVRETWLVEDGWWTQQPLRRRYWEVLTQSGRILVVFHDLESGHWFTQRC